jgi:hypothetical protein
VGLEISQFRKSYIDYFLRELAIIVKTLVSGPKECAYVQGSPYQFLKNRSVLLMRYQIDSAACSLRKGALIDIVLMHH